MSEKKIVIISDSSGRTAKRLLDSVLVQYHKENLSFTVERTYSEVRLKRDLNQVFENIDESYLVVYSIVSTGLDKYFCRKLQKRNILHLNVLKPMLDTIAKFLGVHPDYQPGLLQIIDDRYYRKVDSIGYTVGHDDGLGESIDDADAILVGPSRSCKTPISMYLACNHGLRVANIPIVHDKTLTRNLLRRLGNIPPKRVVGLLMQPSVLQRVREARMTQILANDSHQEQMQDYHNLREVSKEYRFCRNLYTTRRWHSVDVTRRAIEEIALEIIKKRGLLA
ncbi:MAG: kinase/pyrophosphorylase [candidate division Zixibacteria bacterium]|nr:kinase/pyrophosphorylase [candidate division Zixibacteria bacterium]